MEGNDILMDDLDDYFFNEFLYKNYYYVLSLLPIEVLIFLLIYLSS